MHKTGGRGETRTHGGVAPTAVFKTAALNHSATLPAYQTSSEFIAAQVRKSQCPGERLGGGLSRGGSGRQPSQEGAGSRPAQGAAGTELAGNLKGACP